jgi:hypothetical protein
MRCFSTIVGVALAGLVPALAPGPAASQEEAGTPQTGPGDSVDVGALRAIEDMQVRNAAGEEIGEIDEVLVDGAGRIVAVTVEIGGFLDIGDESLIVETGDLAWGEDGFTLDLTDGELGALPRFE